MQMPCGGKELLYRGMLKTQSREGLHTVKAEDIRWGCRPSSLVLLFCGEVG